MIDEGLYGYTIVMAFVSRVFNNEPALLVLDFLYDINRDVLYVSANSQLRRSVSTAYVLIYVLLCAARFKILKEERRAWETLFAASDIGRNMTSVIDDNSEG